MILQVKDVVKFLGRKQVLSGLSFSISKGTLNGIVGENGSGKSTLLKIIVGQWSADSGEVTVNGKIGYCPQQVLVYSQLTVEENFQYFSVAYGLEHDLSQHQIERLLEHFNFKQYRQHKVADLSGGTQQKLNLAIALLHQPDLLILDEPYNGFDWETYQCFWQLISKLKENGCTILIVTHLLSETTEFDQVYQLKSGRLQ